MEGAVDNVEPHVRPGLSNLPAQAGQVIPPLLPELRAILCTGSSEQTINSGGFIDATYLITVSVELCSNSIGVLTCGYDFVMLKHIL